jgi:hypothetical protein
MVAGARAGVPSAVDSSGPGDASVQEPYRKAIKYGVAEYEAHHFEEALGYFRHAHQLFPNARTFRGIGMASFELRDYVTAVRSLKAALDDSRKPLSPELRKETQELLDRCQNLVAVYRLKTTPADAQVIVDTKVPEFQPDGGLMLGLGAHVIEGRAKGYAPRVLSVQVRGGERQELLIALDPLVLTSPVPPTGAGGPDSITAGLAPQAVSDNRKAKAWLWSGGGLAVLSIGAGIYWGRQSNALDSCRAPERGYQCDNESMLKLETNLAAVGTIVTGAAAVAAVTIGILSWKSRPSASAKKGAMACAVVPFGLTCGGAF